MITKERSRNQKISGVNNNHSVNSKRDRNIKLVTKKLQLKLHQSQCKF